MRCPRPTAMHGGMRFRTRAESFARPQRLLQPTYRGLAHPLWLARGEDVVSGCHTHTLPTMLISSFRKAWQRRGPCRPLQATFMHLRETRASGCSLRRTACRPGMRWCRTRWALFRYSPLRRRWTYTWAAWVRRVTTRRCRHSRRTGQTCPWVRRGCPVQVACLPAAIGSFELSHRFVCFRGYAWPCIVCRSSTRYPIAGLGHTYLEA